MREHIILFSGPYDIQSLGATRSIDIPFASALSRAGGNVILMSVGSVAIEGLTHVRVFKGEPKVLRALCRKAGVSRLYSMLWTILVEYKMNNLINKLNINLHEAIIIGRAGMSYRVFKKINSLGGITILHSSWTHPKIHEKILGREYKRLGFSQNPLPYWRKKRQLVEIDTVHRIWCISKMVESSYIEAGVHQDKLFYLPLGVSTRPQFWVKEQKQRKQIMSCGQVNFEKGSHILLQSLLISKIQSVDVVFNGAISKSFIKTWRYYELKLAELDIKIVSDPGVPDRNYVNSDIFVLPSIHDSFGLVVLEAMSYGLPVVISDNVGAKDCLDQIGGRIFPSGDTHQLAILLVNLINNEEELRKMGERNVDKVENYDWGTIAEDFLRSTHGISRAFLSRNNPNPDDR